MNTQHIITESDIELLDLVVSLLLDEISKKHLLDNDHIEQLEELVAEAVKLGEFCERQKWQTVIAQATEKHKEDNGEN